jgi:hypothetical protein
MQTLDLDAFRDELTSLMQEAAKQARVELLPGDIAFSVRGDCVIANALIAPPENVPMEEADKIFLLYLSLPPDNDLSTKIPTGCYVVERVPDQKSPRARVVNLEGAPVLEVPLNVIKTELPPEYGWGTGTPTRVPVTHSQAIIEQSRETLYRVTVLQGHGTICYPDDGVWYWTWIVIVVIEG